ISELPHSWRDCERAPVPDGALPSLWDRDDRLGYRARHRDGAALLSWERAKGEDAGTCHPGPVSAHPPYFMKILDVSARARFWLLGALYGSELAASLWLAYELRFDFTVDPASQHERLLVFAWLVPLQLILLGLFHQLKTLLGYFSTPDLA